MLLKVMDRPRDFRGHIGRPRNSPQRSYRSTGGRSRSRSRERRTDRRYRGAPRYSDYSEAEDMVNNYQMLL